MDGETRRRGSVLLKGVRGIFLEIFEKSIDKHKIDAILECAVQSERFPEGGCSGKWARRSPEDSTEESGITIPIQSAVEIAGCFHVFIDMEGNGARGLCAELRGGVL